MKELIDLLAGRSDSLELDRAALELAAIEFPGLDPEPWFRVLDDYAAVIADRAADLDDGREFVKAANEYLFEDVGLRGNTEDYYDPRNSCLNHVLAEHAGIPITLSVIYMEVARRLAKPVRGIGLPGHFVVQYDDGEYNTFIDPFHGGALVTPEDCYALAGMTAPDPRALAPSGKREIVLRMLNNLRGVYLSRQAFAKAVPVLDLLLGAQPDSANEYKQRGVAHLHNRQMAAAKADFEKYLKLAPEAEDRKQTEEQVHSIARWLAMMN